MQDSVSHSSLGLSTSVLFQTSQSPASFDCKEGFLLREAIRLNPNLGRPTLTIFCSVPFNTEYLRQVVDILERRPPCEHAWPFGLILKGPMPHGRDFLRFAKFGTLQYSVIKPVGALVSLFLSPFGLFREA